MVNFVRGQNELIGLTPVENLKSHQIVKVQICSWGLLYVENQLFSAGLVRALKLEGLVVSIELQMQAQNRVK